MKKWNHYVCPECGGVTIARHDDEGVTPFLLRCRVKDTLSGNVRAHGCCGLAESNFFNGSQNDNQKPHVIFFRPGPMEAIEWISTNVKDFNQKAWLLDHYKKGGSLMREA